MKKFLDIYFGIFYGLCAPILASIFAILIYDEWTDFYGASIASLMIFTSVYFGSKIFLKVQALGWRKFHRLFLNSHGVKPPDSTSQTKP